MSGAVRVVASMHAKPGQEDAVRVSVSACVEPSRRETGNISYIAMRGVPDPAMFIVVEHQASSGARDKHLQSDHSKRLIDQVAGAGRLDAHVFYVAQDLA